MTNFVPAENLRSVRLAVAEVGETDGARERPYLLLHSGAGPRSMAGFADLLARRSGAQVLMATHPGFGGTFRPDSLSTTRDLAAAYVALLDELGLSDVTLLGNSFGGWVAAEMAMLGSRRVGSAVLVDAIGIEVDGHPMAGVAGLAPADLQRLSFHDPAKAPRPQTASGTGLSPDVQALVAYAGPTMSDSSLAGRLGDISLPVHVLWGGSDGIVDVDYGRAYAAAVPNATFTVLPRTGHLPQVETPDELVDAVLHLGA